jgi:thymidylate synthase (FAD)
MNEQLKVDASTLQTIKLLDHGHIRLVDWMGTDESVVRAARVSYDAVWRAGRDEGSDTRLINYLWNHKHTSPFESVQFTFDVKAPIFVFRQWHRHRTWSYNELSARYRELPEEYYIPSPTVIGTQSKDNKQGRQLDPELEKQREDEIVNYRDHCHDAFMLYRSLLKEGWPRELARSVLPLSTYSHMFATVSLLNLFKLITLRSDQHAQYEIRVYSDAMLKLIEPIVPVCVGAFKGGILNG